MACTGSAQVTPDASAGGAFAALSASVRKQLDRLGLRTPFDLVLHLPLRYEDETHLTRLRDGLPGATVQVEVEVLSTEVHYRPRRILVCRTREGQDELTLRFFNFYPSQVKQLAAGRRLRALGELRKGFFGAEMIHPRYRMVSPGEPLPAALTPVYPTTAGLAQHALRKLIGGALASEDLSDTLPQPLLERLELAAFADSVHTLHSPPPEVSLAALEARSHPAWRRIKFDELLAQQLSMRLHHRRRQQAQAPAMGGPQALSAALLDALPFRLTTAQGRALEQIRADLGRPHPMQRLLQGDVGSGKTVVAALAALQAVESGWQVAVMAPTEILAEQHFEKFAAWLTPLGVRVARLAGSLARKDKRAAVAEIESGVVRVAVGTHALFQDQVGFQRLGLAVVDEQHRFGVEQRLALRRKGTDLTAQMQPHQLMMSATPIPRTLAMTYYADLDVSVIDELPPGRTPVVTKLVSEARREEVIARVRDACLEGRQAYWVCPLIEESEALQLQTAIDTCESLRSAFPELVIGLVHGRLPAADKAAVMDAFKAGRIQLLVATTVIEVGVDVPNASLMVIEHAERMGLSQMHQLRGRVGRGAPASACILLYQQPLSDNARERLRIMYEHTDGFEIARHDLRLRGPGEMLGARQSGVPLLRFADLEADADLIDAARDAAERLLHADPQRAHAHLERWMGGRQDFLRV
jgi:ATP-dependent DNA helicase RecG